MLLHNLFQYKISMIKSLPWLLSILLLSNHIDAHDIQPCRTQSLNNQFNGFIASKTELCIEWGATHSIFSPVAVSIIEFDSVHVRIAVSTDGTDSLLTMSTTYEGIETGNDQIFFENIASTSLATTTKNKQTSLAVVAGSSITDDNKKEGIIQPIKILIVPVEIAVGSHKKTVYKAVTEIFSPILFDQVPSFNGAVIGQFNLENDLDLSYSLALTATNNSNQGCVYIFVQPNNNSDFEESSYYNVGKNPLGIAMGHLTKHPGRYDLIVANHDDNTVNILYGNGRNEFYVSHEIYPTCGKPAIVAVGNLNSNDYHQYNKTGKKSNYSSILGCQQLNQDFAVTSRKYSSDKPPENIVNIFFNNNYNRTFTSITIPAPRNNDSEEFCNPGLAIGNLSNHKNHQEDIIVGNENGIQLLVNDGHNSFIPSQIYYQPCMNSSSIAVGKISSASYLDLFVGSQSNFSLTTLYQNIRAPCMRSKSTAVPSTHEILYNIDLTWNNIPSSDRGNEISSYTLYRNGIMIAQNIHGTPGDHFTTFIDPGLKEGCYEYLLFGVAGNLTTAPSAVVVTVPNPF